MKLNKRGRLVVWVYVSLCLCARACCSSAEIQVRWLRLMILETTLVQVTRAHRKDKDEITKNLRRQVTIPPLVVFLQLCIRRAGAYKIVSGKEREVGGKTDTRWCCLNTDSSNTMVLSFRNGGRNGYWGGPWDERGAGQGRKTT